MRVHVAKQSITRVMKAERRKNGGVAQLGEHLPCKQGVMGSIPIISTRSESFTIWRERQRDTPKSHGHLAQLARALG